MNSPPFPDDRVASSASAPPSRTPFVLAAIGSGVASLYWAGLTLLIALGAAFGSVSAAQIILPCVLIGLYAWRAVQVFKGDPDAGRRLLFLHGIGGISAVLQIVTGGPLMFVLQGIKLMIHVFGGVTAYMASRAPRLTEAPPW